MAMVAITGNTYPVKDQLKAMGARWNSVAKCWEVAQHLAAQAQAIVPVMAPRTGVATADMKRVFEFFAAAKAHGLKKPMIRLTVVKDESPVNLYPAKSGGANDGSLYAKRDGVWLGTINPDGTFKGSRELTAALSGILVPALVELAADPLAAVQKSARLASKCCFCNLTLDSEDGKSQAAGMGKKCATNWGLEAEYAKAVPFAPSKPVKTAPAPVAAAVPAAELDLLDAALAGDASFDPEAFDVDFDPEDGSDVIVPVRTVADDVAKWIAELNAAAAKLRAAGLTTDDLIAAA
jgi:hypothetical protein